MVQDPSPQMIKLFENLSRVKKPDDLSYIEQTMGDSLYGTLISISLPEYAHSFYSPIKFPSSFSQNYIVPYLCHPYIYFIHHEIIRPYRIKIDCTVTFDTNFASYVKTVVSNHSLKNLEVGVRLAFDHILRNELNFDSIFYFIENIKIAYSAILKSRSTKINSPLHFWKLLDKEFRWNIVCLELFKGIKCNHFSASLLLATCSPAVALA
jgi:hypothetical protein